MSLNLNRILKEIIDNESLVAQFLSLKTMDEMYDFFLKRDGSITKKEFDDFIVLMLESYSQEQLEQLNEKRLQNVSGGADNLKLKSISLAMAALTISTPLASAANVAGVESESTTNKIVSQIKIAGVSAKNLADKAWVKTRAWVKKNQDNLLIGGSLLSAVVIGGGVTYFLNKSAGATPVAGIKPAVIAAPVADAAHGATTGAGAPRGDGATPDAKTIADAPNGAGAPSGHGGTPATGPSAEIGAPIIPNISSPTKPLPPLPAKRALHDELIAVPPVLRPAPPPQVRPDDPIVAAIKKKTDEIRIRIYPDGENDDSSDNSEWKV